jgi:hypothetical protein
VSRRAARSPPPVFSTPSWFHGRWVAANLYAGRSAAPASYVHLRDFATAMQVRQRERGIGECEEELDDV